MPDLALRIALQCQDMMSNVVKSAGSTLQSFGSTLGGINPILGVAAGAAIAVGGALASCIQPAANFQTQMMQLVTGAGESASNLQMVSDGILNMAATTGTSTDQLAAGMYQIESAGYHGAAGLQVLQSAAEGAKVGNADLASVANGVTTALTDYGLSANQSAQVTNDLIATVANGKTTMQQLASSLSSILPVSSAAGVSLRDTSAALATMTGEGVPASQAATYLRQTILALQAPSSAGAKALESVGLTTQEVADKMKQSLPDALQMITDAVGKKFPVGSAQYLAAIKNISGGTKTMQGMLDLTGTHLDTFKNNVANISGAVKQGGNSITGWSQVQGTFNQKMAEAQSALQALQIKIGTALLPVITSLASNIAPLIGKFTDWITKSGVLQATASTLGNAFSFIGTILGALGTAIGSTIAFFQKHQTAMNALKAVLIGVGAAILIFAATSIPPLLVAFGAWAVAAGAAALATLAATWPFIAIGAVVAAVAFGIIEAIQHWGQIVDWLKGVWGAFSSWFMSALGAIGNFFHGIWDGILSGLKTAWNAIVNVVKTGAMLLLAAILGPILAIAGAFVWLYNHNYYFKALIDSIVGVVKAGLAWVQTAWQISVTWLVGVWQGIVKFATDLWNQISGAIKTGFTAAIGFVTAVWTTISGVFTSAWNTYIAKPLTALWQNVSKVFSSAWNTYIAGPISSLWTSLSTTVSGWATTAVQWGKNLIQSFVNGIVSMANSVAGAVGGIAGKVLAFLGFHSPTKEGPGREADQWAPNLVKMYSQGIESGLPQIQSAVNKLTKPIAMSLGVTNTGVTNVLGSVNLKSPALSSSPLQGGSSASGNGTTVNTFNITITTQGGWSRNQIDDMYKQIKQKLDQDYRKSGNHITNTSGGRV